MVFDGAAVPAGTPAQSPTPAKRPVLEPTPEPPPAAAPSAEPPGLPGEPPAALPPAKPSGTTALPENAGLLTIWVPADATVTVNGRPTISTGSKRQFVSYGLKPGLSYKYEVRAEIVRDGQPVSEVKTVVLTGGERSGLAFGLNKPAAEVASR